MENEFEDEEAMLYANTSENPPPQDDVNAPQYAPEGGDGFPVNEPQNQPNGGVHTYINALQSPAPHGSMQTFNNVVQHLITPHGVVQRYNNAFQHPTPHGGVVQTYDNASQHPPRDDVQMHINYAPPHPPHVGVQPCNNTTQNVTLGSANPTCPCANRPQNLRGGFKANAPQHLPQVTAIDYSTGLFDFNDINLLCVSLWLPFITFGQIAEIVDKGSSTCGANALKYGSLCFTGGHFLYSYMYGSKIKAQYGIHSDNIADVCTHIWCQPCVLTQEYRELQIRGYDPAFGWYGHMLKLNNPAMTAPPVPGGMTR